MWAVKGVLTNLGNSPGKRLALFRKSLGLSQRAFADSVGASPGSVSFIESDERTPSKDFLVKISERYHVSGDWLLHGVGDMLMPAPVGFQGDRHRIDPPDPGTPLAGDFRSGDVSYALVPRLDLDLSAGPGRVAAAQLPTLPGLALPQAWFTERGVSADFCRLVRVRGDSMAPCIPDGSTVLVDCSARFLRKAGVYAFTRDQDVFVKRLVAGVYAFTRDQDVFVKRLVPALDARGKAVSVTILSDNQAFPAQVVTGEAMNALQIQGLVRAVLAVV